MMKQISDKIWKFYFDNFGSNCYFIKADGKNIMVDTSGEENRDNLIKDLSKLSIKPKDIGIILLTHLHYDHIGNLELFSNAGVYASEQEIEDFRNNPFQAVLNENIIEKIVEGKGSTKPTYEFVKLGKAKVEHIGKLKVKSIEAIESPGHTRGSLCFYMPSEKVLFSGDTIFEEGIGRTDLPTSDAGKMDRSLKKLNRLGYKILCAGH